MTEEQRKEYETLLHYLDRQTGTQICKEAAQAIRELMNASPASVRAAALEEAAKECDRIEAGMEDMRSMNLDAEGYATDIGVAYGNKALGANHCAVAIRALSAAPAGGLGEVDVEALIPDGWLLSSVDASMKAHGKSELISVMLVKDKAGRDAYHALSEEEQETALLYWCEHGYTIRDAIIIAAQAIAAAQGEGK